MERNIHPIGQRFRTEKKSDWVPVDSSSCSTTSSIQRRKSKGLGDGNYGQMDSLNNENFEDVEESNLIRKRSSGFQSKEKSNTANFKSPGRCGPSWAETAGKGLNEATGLEEPTNYNPASDKAREDLEHMRFSRNEIYLNEATSDKELLNAIGLRETVNPKGLREIDVSDRRGKKETRPSVRCVSRAKGKKMRIQSWKDGSSSFDEAGGLLTQKTPASMEENCVYKHGDRETVVTIDTIIDVLRVHVIARDLNAPHIIAGENLIFLGFVLFKDGIVSLYLFHWRSFSPVWPDENEILLALPLKVMKMKGSSVSHRRAEEQICVQNKLKSQRSGNFVYNGEMERDGVDGSQNENLDVVNNASVQISKKEWWKTLFLRKLLRGKSLTHFGYYRRRRSEAPTEDPNGQKVASEEDINISQTDVDPMAEQADRSQGSSTAMGGFGAVRDHLRRNQAEKGEDGVEGSRLVVSNGQNSHRNSGGERQPALVRAAAARVLFLGAFALR
ncbi:hypothetical protein GQ457_07G003640 [Hibiscus cannabinus]